MLDAIILWAIRVMGVGSLVVLGLLVVGLAR